MAFHDVLLPDGFQYASGAGAGFATIIQETASGHEVRVARQAQARHKFRMVKALQTSVEAKALKAFAIGRRGALHSFKVKDFSDYTSASDGETAPSAVDQAIGVGDASEESFQLVKLYDSTGDAPYTRTIALPISGTVVVAVDGVTTTAFVVNSTGSVVFNSPPANGTILTAGFQFYVPVRFETGFDQWCQLQADAYGVWSLPNMDLVEVLSEVEMPERRSFGGSTTFDPATTTVHLTLNDGQLIWINPSSSPINVILPQTSRVPGGPEIFTISVKTGAAGTIQVRDDAGVAVGATFAAGVTKRVGLARNGTTSTWVLY